MFILLVACTGDAEPLDSDTTDLGAWTLEEEAALASWGPRSVQVRLGSEVVEADELSIFIPTASWREDGGVDSFFDIILDFADGYRAGALTGDFRDPDSDNDTLTDGFAVSVDGIACTDLACAEGFADGGGNRLSLEPLGPFEQLSLSWGVTHTAGLALDPIDMSTPILFQTLSTGGNGVTIEQVDTETDLVFGGMPPGSLVAAWLDGERAASTWEEGGISAEDDWSSPALVSSGSSSDWPTGFTAWPVDDGVVVALSWRQGGSGMATGHRHWEPRKGGLSAIDDWAGNERTATVTIAGKPILADLIWLNTEPPDEETARGIEVTSTIGLRGVPAAMGVVDAYGVDEKEPVAWGELGLLMNGEGCAEACVSALSAMGPTLEVPLGDNERVMAELGWTTDPDGDWTGDLELREGGGWVRVSKKSGEIIGMNAGNDTGGTCHIVTMTVEPEGAKRTFDGMVECSDVMEIEGPLPTQVIVGSDGENASIGFSFVPVRLD